MAIQLDSVRAKADLNPTSPYAQNLYAIADFYELAYDLHTQNGGIDSITGSQITELENLMNDSTAMSVNAANILEYLELKEKDLRYVSDYVIAENTFKEFPHFSMPIDGNLHNKIAQLNNNAFYEFDVVRDANGEPMLNQQGEQYYENGYTVDTNNNIIYNSKKYDLTSKDKFNAIYWGGADGLYNRGINQIEKSIRFKRN